MQSKKCSMCKIVKPLSDYFRDNRRKVGVRCRCKECCRIETYSWRDRNRSEYNNYAAAWRAKNPDKQHATDIKRHYSLSIEDYNRLLTEQSCRCKICGYQHNPEVKRGRLYVDHCHDTGRVRGLLCALCNSALGGFKSDVALLKAASEYLAPVIG